MFPVSFQVCFCITKKYEVKKSKKVLSQCISLCAYCNSAYCSPTWVAPPRTLASASDVEFA